ncbi:hypothetical protein DFH07DRAFT_1031737, partial [Mycena maculata]
HRRETSSPACLRETRRSASGRPTVDALEDIGDGVPPLIVRSADVLDARLSAPHSLPNSSGPRATGTGTSSTGGMHMRTLSPSCRNVHCASALPVPLRCRRRMPGCTAANGSVLSSCVTVAVDAVEYELAREEDELCEDWDVSGEGASMRVGDERTVGERRGSVERATDVGHRFGGGGAPCLLGGGRETVGTSTGKRAGRSGRPAFLRILRVKTGMLDAIAGWAILISLNRLCDASNTFTSLPRYLRELGLCRVDPIVANANILIRCDGSLC